MAARNLVTEIQARNARANGSGLHARTELYTLDASTRRLADTDRAALALHVMGIASCIEVGVREAIKQLVDSGGDFLSQAEQFKFVRFDFELTRALSAGQISFGDLISHSLPVSSLEHIALHFETLFSSPGSEAAGPNGHKSKVKKFRILLQEIKVYVEPGEEELFSDAPPGTAQSAAGPLLGDPQSLLADIELIFQTRHLVAHEAAFNVTSRSQLDRFLDSAHRFLDALYELVEQRLHPGASRSGMGSSIQNMQRMGELVHASGQVAARITDQLEGMGDRSESLTRAFTDTQEMFEQYVQLESEFRLALHGIATGNAIRNIEAHVGSQLWRAHRDYLLDVEENVGFYAEVEVARCRND